MSPVRGVPHLSWLALVWVSALAAVGLPTAYAVELPDAGAPPSPDRAEAVEAAAAGPTIEALREIESRVVEAVDRVSPATVAVQARTHSGSGVVVKRGGSHYVLTAGHVSGRPGGLVALRFPDGKTLRGEVLGRHLGADAGLIRLMDEDAQPPFAAVGATGSDTDDRGDWVIALGHPNGFQQDRGVVTRLGKVLGVRPTVVWSTCTVISGDSGGPLVDLDGRIVGIHSRIGAETEQNYHVPIAVFHEHWDRLAAGEEFGQIVRRPRGPLLGVTVALEEDGLMIEQVAAGSPAEKAGVEAGDRLVEVDGREISELTVLRRVIARHGYADGLEVVVERDGERLELSADLRRRQSERRSDKP